MQVNSLNELDDGTRLTELNLPSLEGVDSEDGGEQAANHQSDSKVESGGVILSQVRGHDFEVVKEDGPHSVVTVQSFLFVEGLMVRLQSLVDLLLQLVHAFHVVVVFLVQMSVVQQGTGLWIHFPRLKVFVSVDGWLFFSLNGPLDYSAFAPVVQLDVEHLVLVFDLLLSDLSHHLRLSQDVLRVEGLFHDDGTPVTVAYSRAVGACQLLQLLPRPTVVVDRVVKGSVEQGMHLRLERRPGPREGVVKLEGDVDGRLAIDQFSC